MNPKSEKPLRLFVNPLAIWTNFALKSGEAMLASAQAAVARPRALKVGVIHEAKAAPKAKAASRAKVRGKAKQKKRRAKR